jgi:hypothetical protein
MNKKTILMFFATTILLVPSAARAQMGRSIPGIKGVFTPIVGAGAEYEMIGKDSKKQRMEIAITGSEQIDGKTAYWMEYAMPDAKAPAGNVKMLVALNADKTITSRMVMRMGSEVVEMDMNLPMMKSQQTSSPTDLRQTAERVGTENITVPAGTFVCEHWRAKDGSGEYWISDKVRPLGIVKSTGKDGSLVLTRVFTDATTKLPPPYKKFDPMEMMRQQQQHP